MNCVDCVLDSITCFIVITDLLVHCVVDSVTCFILITGLLVHSVVDSIKCFILITGLLVHCVVDSITCFIVITGLLTLLFILFFRCDYRRLRFEEQTRAETIISSHTLHHNVISS